MRGALHHLQGDELLISGKEKGSMEEDEGENRAVFLAAPLLSHSRQIPAQPNGREVTPSEFSDYVISVVEEVANLHWVVSSCKRE